MVMALLATQLALLSIGLSGCALAQSNDSMGMTLLFMNKGPYSIGVRRFDPDGLRGPTPGALGASTTEGKQMSFMPGDSKRGVPQFVEVGWTASTPASKTKLAEYDLLFPHKEGGLSKEDIAQRDEFLKHAYSLANTYTRRIDLTPILTPELLAQVRANRSSTNLKLTIVFEGENVTITATPEIWRK
jgi:hypothetical protein